MQLETSNQAMLKRICGVKHSDYIHLERTKQNSTNFPISVTCSHALRIDRCFHLKLHTSIGMLILSRWNFLNSILSSFCGHICQTRLI